MGLSAIEGQYAALDAASGDQLIRARMKAARCSVGMSQESIGAAMKRRGYNWMQTTVSKIESGERPIYLGEAVAFSQIVGTPLASLAGEAVLPAPDGARALVELRAVADEVSRRIDSLTQGPCGQVGR